MDIIAYGLFNMELSVATILMYFTSLSALLARILALCPMSQLYILIILIHYRHLAVHQDPFVVFFGICTAANSPLALDIW